MLVRIGEAERLFGISRSRLMKLVKAGKVKSVPITVRPLEKAYDTIVDLAEGNVVGRVVLTTED